MSWTSCYNYAVQLSQGALGNLIGAVISQGDTAEFPTTFDRPGVPVPGGELTVDVVGNLVHEEGRLTTVDITTNERELVLRLNMDLTATVQGVPGLEPLAYQLAFQLPGNVARNDATDPHQVELTFADVDVDDLGLVIDGGLVFTPALFEGPIDTFFEEHPRYDVDEDAWYIAEPVTIATVTTFARVWFYDDSMRPITVDVITDSQIRVNIPGHILATDISAATAYEADFMVALLVDIVPEAQPDGSERLVVKLSQIALGDITVAMTNVTVNNLGPLANAAVGLVLQGRVHDELAATTDISLPYLAPDVVSGLIAGEIVDYARAITLPLLPLAQEGGGGIDMSDATVMTVAGEVLALGVEKLGDDCDTLDVLAPADGFAVAVSAPRMQIALDSIEAALDGRNVEFGGYDVTMGRPTAALSNAGEHGMSVGHIWVTGDVVVHVGGCVGDVDAHYAGAITVAPVNAPDGSLTFAVTAHNFEGDADAKDKKEDFDPDAVGDLIAGMDFSLPEIPRHFQGVGDIVLDYQTAELGTQGMVLRGGVSITLLNLMMLSGIWPSTSFWFFDSAHGED